MSTVRALVLDPVAGDVHFARMKTRLETEHGWQVRTLPMFLPGMDGKAWIDNFESSLDWASTIIGLGDFTAFYLTGSPEEYFKKLVAKSKERCALIFQLDLLASSDDIGSISNTILRNWEVQRTPYRLISRDRLLSLNPYPIELLRGDRSFRDRDLTKNIKEITLDGASVLDYDGEAIPAVIAPELLLAVDKTTDLARKNQLGEHDALVVVRNPEPDSLQAFIGGNALKDPVDVMAGRMPGIELNETLLDNLARMAEEVAAAPPYDTQVFNVFNKLERVLGKFVDEAIRKLKCTAEPERFFPSTVCKNIRDKSTGCLDFSRCGYWDIVEIMRENRALFAPFMEPVAGGDFIGFLKPLNRNQRLLLAHPHKAEQEDKKFTQRDVDEVRDRLIAVRKAYIAFQKKHVASSV